MIALAIVLSYFVGSIPTGVWLGRALKGVDIREHGSHNIGATNTMRVLGKKLGAAALAVDILKGVVPVVAACLFLPGWPFAPVACGLAAIVGHVTSPFVGFKGGKGVATSTGVFLALAPYPTLIAAAAFFAVLGATRMVSASSITAAVVLSTLTFVFTDNVTIRALAVVVALLVIVRHRSNIQRILKGTENRI